ncbi:peroxisome biogenesis protein NDAI_0K02550 [Naumovozyma dairenensis CBS 421]|uniref:Peroxin/Ferlin domain-containing protein n=1 Tax=Naumovozyma dairenensis (strain ATCC 10597 / BCRC 20456 / CBS 421 / NBRC 0211 / NRRL Y-12639) TaxID=1071378 RepID=G0WI35_NAUDC|nr:hypothetical protein NDAI_0K02550 [Naumovozyma dairenensis CBS 421]CCD27446.1 hypothetical protein NDAI_0K02550 [Naumovozyma dairenensis CBS 421]
MEDHVLKGSSTAQLNTDNDNGLLLSPERMTSSIDRKTMKSSLKRRLDNSKRSKEEDDSNAISTVISSPLLKPTPPTVSNSLVNLYPYLIVANDILSILTWTNDNMTINFVIMLCYTIIVSYFQFLSKYFSHILVIGIIGIYSLIGKSVNDTVESHPTLDDIIQVITLVTKKSNLILEPIDILTLQDIKRLFFTTVFLSPIYIILTLFILTPKQLLLGGGIYVLGYHSPWFRRIRSLLWEFKMFRVFIFYITGLDLSNGIQRHNKLFAQKVHAKWEARSRSKSKNKLQNDSVSNIGETVEFTYVIFENQRKWLGIGWTSSMLSYERSSWTDEFLNQVPDITHFKLPREDSVGMTWEWVDDNWNLDLTNNGSIQLNSKNPKFVTNPNINEGYIYFDNTWKNPSTDDTFGKYTRRRRWVRRAVLINMKTPNYNTILPCIDTEGQNPVKIENLVDDKQVRNRDRKVSFSEIKNIRIIPQDEKGLLDIPYEEGLENAFKKEDITLTTD